MRERRNFRGQPIKKPDARRERREEPRIEKIRSDPTLAPPPGSNRVLPAIL